jgi:benzoyl-CoA reductase/2-hydroxyglutaryl-CoA dehydratase subunit BcrC/BadD/HgdB
VLAVELWGPPGPPRGHDAGRIQSYVCPIARNALAFLAAGGADAVDGVLFPHTCDSIQGLATLATDFGGWSRPAFTFQHPKSLARPSAREFLGSELRSLGTELEAFAGRALEPGALGAAIELHEEIDGARAALLSAGPRLAMSDRELYALLRRGEWLWPEDHLRELQSARRALGDVPARPGVPILFTGYVPEPAALFDVLEAAGGYVAGDDYAAIGRRIAPRYSGPRADPWKVLVERYASYPPCPTRSADTALRTEHLTQLLDRRGARGVILHLVKFCEPELFDVPALRGAFARRGVPVLQVDTELERELSAQTITRLEAFVEMLSAGRAA